MVRHVPLKICSVADRSSVSIRPGGTKYQDIFIRHPADSALADYSRNSRQKKPNDITFLLIQNKRLRLQQKGKVKGSKKENQKYDVPVVAQQSQCCTIVRTLL